MSASTRIPTRGSSASALALVSLRGSGADINRPRPAAGLDDGRGWLEVEGGGRFKIAASGFHSGGRRLTDRRPNRSGRPVPPFHFLSKRCRRPFPSAALPSAAASLINNTWCRSTMASVKPRRWTQGEGRHEAWTA